MSEGMFFRKKEAALRWGWGRWRAAWRPVQHGSRGELGRAVGIHVVSSARTCTAQEGQGLGCWGASAIPAILFPSKCEGAGPY